MKIKFEKDIIESDPKHLQRWFIHRPNLARDVLIDELLDVNKNSKKYKGSVGGATEITDAVLKIRNVDLCLVPYKEHPKLYHSTIGIAKLLNKDFFGFDISKIEKITILNYGEGQFYTPHIDTSFEENECRKLTMIIGLTDKNEYEGGELVLFPNGVKPTKIKMNKGDIVLFPTFILHEVTTVISGNRITAVTWIWGSKFK